MSQNKRKAWPALLFCLVVGSLLGAAIATHWVWIMGNLPGMDSGNVRGRREPLYWVAPMNPDYRRDQPGKSPMGMDLVPVYEETAGEQSPGTVSISPNVVNNMGVRTATAVRGQLAVTVNTVGYVQYDEDRLVHIHPRVEGWIEKLHIKAEGDRIRKDTPLYALYSPMLVNAQEEYLLAVKRNNRALVAAAEERLSALQVPAAEIARLKRSGTVSHSITINAPQSGVVNQLSVREGMYVKPGMEMMSVGMLDQVWVIGEVFERQASLLHVGDPVTMQLDYLPGRQWQGQVDYLYPSLNTRTRTAQVRVRFSNADEDLKPGMFAEMRIDTSLSGETLLIPREALIRTGGQDRVVLALGEGRFKSVAVDVGRIVERQAEIVAGLGEGDRIVISAQFLIDSESSKTSDFRRLFHDQREPDQHSSRPETVWTGATVESIRSDPRQLELAHEAIESWQWPAMVMNFSVADSVNLDALQPGMKIHVQLRRSGSNRYTVTRVHIPGAGRQAADLQVSPGQQQLDHSRHQEMKHGASGHQQHNRMAAPAGGMDHAGHGQEQGQ